MNGKNSGLRVARWASALIKPLYIAITCTINIAPAHAVQLNDDGDGFMSIGSLSPANIVLAKVHTPIACAEGCIIVDALMAGGMTDTTCEWGELIGPLYSSSQLIQNNYNNPAVQKVLSTAADNCRIRDNGMLNDATLSIYYRTKGLSPGGNAGYRFEMDRIVVVPTPAKCSATISDMNFGLIKPGDHPSAESRLAVSCNKEAALTITVNGGRDLNDTSSSAYLSFDHNSTSNCDASCAITIKGTMSRTPAPGSQKWSVPVTVDYQ